MDQRNNSNRRWLILAAYTLVALSSQAIWLNFSGIAVPQVETIYRVNVSEIGYLAAFWPLIFIPLSIPTGILVDRIGFRKVVSIGALIIAFFSWMRIFAGRDFLMLVVFQSLAGIGQPFIFNGISKIAGTWFPPGEQAVATGVGTLGQILGMIVALIVAPLMVPLSSFSELRTNMIVFSLIATVAFILFFIISRENSSFIPSSDKNLVSEIRGLLNIRNIILLMALFFIGVGIFSGLAQWIESMLASRGVSSLTGGIIAASMLISGIAGMIVIPYIADKRSMLKQFIQINSLIAAVFLFLFAFRANIAIYFVIAIVIGFFLLSLAPVGLQLSLETAGEKRSGTSASLIWLASQVGALFLILIMGDLGPVTFTVSRVFLPPWFLTMLVVAVLTLVAFGLSFFIKNTRNSRGEVTTGKR